MKKILASVLFITILTAGILFAMNRNTSDGHDPGKLQVTATYYPLYDFAKHVGGDRVQVANLTPAGAEPHEYEPSPKTLAGAQTAPVLIYNGGHFEPWTDNFLKDYRHTAVRAGDGINLEGAQDPHFWLDAVLAQQIINNIRDGLIKADPAGEDYYRQNAATYNVKLARLDQEYRDGLANCRLNTVISSHEAFSYVAKRYDLKIVAIAGVSPADEPSAAKLAEISRLVRDTGIQYIFFESLVSPRLADTIAAETGAKTLVLDPIEGLTDADQQQGQDYLSVQRENLANLRTALACR
jgi:zinc transport system substrate-binding protein